MGDDTAFDLLHSEIVNSLINSSDIEIGKANDLSKIECVGFSMGFRIIERLTKDMSRFKEEIDIMKFLCTEVWPAVYKRPIDNLRTNHLGTYVLLDNEFKFLSKIASGKQYLEYAPRYVAFSCGVIRGVLANLGIICAVTAEVENMPICKFHIKVSQIPNQS